MKTRSVSSFMIFVLSVIALVYHIQYGYAQYSKLLKLPAHTDVTKMSWWDSVYRFQDFQYGKITYTSGVSSHDKVQLNYNLYFGRIDRINQKGDTVELKPRKLRLVNIGERTFYHDNLKGYIEILVQAPIALGVWNFLTTDRMVFVSGNHTGYSESNSNSRATPSNSHSGGFDLRSCPSIYDRYYSKTSAYFFIDQKSKLHKANKNSILKLFSSNSDEIKAHLQEINVDFNREEDLIRVLNFCNQLVQVKKYDPSEYLKTGPISKL
jgi:hypothetical protein